MSEATISIEDFKKATESEYQSTTELEWRGLTIPVLHHLSLFDMIQFTDSVVSTCFITDTGEYAPEIKDFAVRCAILEYYAGIKLPQDVEERCELVYSSDIISCVVQYVDPEQFNALCRAIDQKIDHIAQSNIEALHKQFGEVIDKFEALEERLSGVFDSIDKDTVSKLAGAIAGGTFDEKRLVQAFKESKENDSADGRVIQMSKKRTTKQQTAKKAK